MSAGKAFAGIVGGVAAVIGGILGWCFRGKKENKRHAKTQQVILGLEQRLRKVESELADVKDLSVSMIQELKAEKKGLQAKIAAARRAA